MGTFAAQFLVLGHISLTIPNKSGFLELYLAGARSEFVNQVFERIGLRVGFTDPFLCKM